MRDDMHKVLVERPRTYRGYRSSVARYPRHENANRARGDAAARADAEAAFDHLPRREGMGHLYATKALNENLAPLRRFLARRVGRPWNRVFAELSARIDGSSAVQGHILEHLDDFVARRVRTLDGVLHYAPPWGGLVPLHGRRRLGRPLLYVCPRTGLLREAPAEPSPRLQPEREVPRFVRLDALHYWFRRDGLWFEVTLVPNDWSAPWPRPSDYVAPARPVDALSHAVVGTPAHSAYERLHDLPWTRTHHAACVRQLGKKALRARFQDR